MAELKHTLKIEGNTLSVGGVKNIDEISEKEAILSLEARKLTIRGDGITVKKLDVDQGTVAFEFQRVDTLIYGGAKGKFSLKDVFR